VPPALWQRVHGATPVLVVLQFGHEEQTERIFRRRILDNGSIPYVFVGIPTRAPPARSPLLSRVSYGASVASQPRVISQKIRSVHQISPKCKKLLRSCGSVSQCNGNVSERCKEMVIS